MPKNKPEESALALQVTIERKDPKLPRFVVIPAGSVEKWGIRETTVVEGIFKGLEMGRRTLKRWDEQRWFIELPEPLCKKAGVDTGSSFTIILRLASNELPEELAKLLAEDASAKAAWENSRRVSSACCAKKSRQPNNRRRGCDALNARCHPNENRKGAAMKHRTIAKITFLLAWIVAAIWLGAASLQAQKPASKKEKVPGHPNGELLPPARPDKQTSELTQEVAAKLPQLGGDQKIIRRNLIDQHLFGAMNRDQVPHAPLTNDYDSAAAFTLT